MSPPLWFAPTNPSAERKPGDVFVKYLRQAQKLGTAGLLLRWRAEAQKQVSRHEHARRIVQRRQRHQTLENDREYSSPCATLAHANQTAPRQIAVILLQKA